MSAMRFWMVLAVACVAVTARSPERSHDLRFVMPVASIDFVESRVLQSRHGRANQANNPRGRYERSGFKNGGRVGAAIGATVGGVAGTVGGGAAGTAIAGPAGGFVGAAVGVTAGIYAGIPLGRKIGSKIGATGGRVVDKVVAHKDAKAKANAPPPVVGKKKLSRSQAIVPSRAEPAQQKTTPSKATTAGPTKPGTFSRAKESIKTSLRNAVTPTANKMFAKPPRPPPAGRSGGSQAVVAKRKR
ncbi:hypothetical protein AeMF1_011952 [Aphanomyces euteiches]|nr:hypothetical protein AeMF1_011952 [Aphanomyces euteiches]KAH9185355.1 hypothetical protein AeNC1_012669 [Aphanomyces euteiches]